MTRITDMTTRTAPTVNALVPFAIPGDLTPYNFDAGQVANYQGAESGSVARSIHDKLSDIKHAKDFGLVGDGSDEGARLTAFFNSAISNPGILHLLHKGTFVTSVVLPQLNVANVRIVGAGAEIHDVGTLVTGTVIKYTGTSAPSSSLVTIAATSGASNQRLSNITFRGIGLDCNTGLIGTGLTMQSVRDYDVQAAVVNAATRSVYVGVVASLGESKDVQKGKLDLTLRQVETSAPGLYLDGDASANVSMNEIWLDAQHTNHPVVICANSDNNQWRFFRASHASGTATESIQFLGGPTSGRSSRNEKFDFFSSTLPARAMGTGDGYAYPSLGHYIFIDGSNGTPNPVVGLGSSINFDRNDSQRIVMPEQFGAKGTGTGDDGPAWNAAFASGKEIKFNPQVTYGVTTPLVIGNGTSTTDSTINGVTITGSGAGSVASEESPAKLPSCIKWLGSGGATVLTINGPISAVNPKGFTIDCNNLAATGIQSNHMMESLWQDVCVTRNTGGFGIILEAYAAVAGFAQGANKNTLTNLRVKNVGASGSGIRIGVTSGYVDQMLDVAQNVFINPCFENDGADASTCAMQLSFCDVLSFIGGQWRPTTGTLGDGVRITPPAGTGNHLKFPAAISFDSPAIRNGFTVDASWVPNQGIKCAAYHTGDGEPIPTSPYIWGTNTNGLSFGSGIGYVAGMGGTVTQATSKATGVTLNKLCGAITLNNAALAAGAIVSFTLTNSLIGADDRVSVWIKSGNATPGSYRLATEGNAVGSRTIVVENKTAGSLSEALVLGFEIYKGSIS